MEKVIIVFIFIFIFAKECFAIFESALFFVKAHTIIFVALTPN